MAMSSGELRERLSRLSWGEGLTRDEIYNQWKHMPPDLFEKLPGGHRFGDAGEVMSYLVHLSEGAPILTSPYGAPADFGPSPTAIPAHESDTTHGIGSGAHEGVTGAEAQTGAHRNGISPRRRRDPDFPEEQEQPS